MEEKYYNHEQKQRWIESINLDQYPAGYWERVFLVYKPFEEELKKDVCNFNKVEIKNMYLDLNYMSFETLMVANYSLSKYTMWALQNAMVDDGINHYADFDAEELVDCTNMRQIKNAIVTLDDIIIGLNKLDNYQDQFILLALFEGIRGKQCEDLCELRLSDISNGKAHLKSGKTISISSKLYHLAVDTNNTYQYTFTDGRVYDMVGDRILKITIKNSKIELGVKTPRSIYTSVIRTIETLGWSDRVTMNSIYNSGIIHMINKLAEQNHCSGEQVLYRKELLQQVQKQYDFNELLRKRFCLKYKDLLKQ